MNKYKYTYEVLDEYGNKMISEMESILIKNGKRATGNLINSLDYDILERKGKDGPERFVLTVEFAEYGQYVNKKNIWRGTMPPVEVIKKWLKAKKIPYQQNKMRYIGGTNLKSLTQEKKLTGLAWAIAKSIKKRGTLNPRYNNPTKFLKPYDDLRMKKGTTFYKDVEKAYKKDIESMVDDTVKKINEKK